MSRKLLGWLEVVDDYGNHKYSVSKIEGDCYYLNQTTFLEDHPLRYNKKEERIEEFFPEDNCWDVYSQYLYQVDFIPNQF